MYVWMALYECFCTCVSGEYLKAQVDVYVATCDDVAMATATTLTTLCGVMMSRKYPTYSCA